MPFMFKLSQRLARSRAPMTAARGLLTPRQVSVLLPTLVPPRHNRFTLSQKNPSGQVGPFVFFNALAEEILS